MATARPLPGGCGFHRRRPLSASPVTRSPIEAHADMMCMSLRATSHRDTRSPGIAHGWSSVHEERKRAEGIKRTKEFSAAAFNRASDHLDRRFDCGRAAFRARSLVQCRLSLSLCYLDRCRAQHVDGHPLPTLGQQPEFRSRRAEVHFLSTHYLDGRSGFGSAPAMDCRPTRPVRSVIGCDRSGHARTGQDDARRWTGNPGRLCCHLFRLRTVQYLQAQ